MNETRDLLERVGERFTFPDDLFERLERRRVRKRRNQRIAAGAVGIAVFVAAIWIVTSVGSLDRSETSVVPGGDVTGPAETGPTETGPTAPTGAIGPSLEVLAGPEGVPEWVRDPSLSRVNLLALPPEGAPPSSPEHGDLVLAVSGRGAAAGWALTHMYVYADGRLIWWREGVAPEGTVFEQRLTPEGVELLRSEVISNGLAGLGNLTDGTADPDPLAFDGSIEVRDGDRLAESFPSWTYWPGDATSEPDAMATAEQERAIELLDARLFEPASWLPASAWADQGIRTYVPTTYRVCYGGTTETIERDRLLHAIPGPVQELLEGQGTRRTNDFNMYLSFGEWANGVRVTGYCSELTTEEARDVVRGLDDGGFEREQLPTYANAPGGEEHAHATFQYIFSVPDPAGTATLWIDPYLPHSEVVCMSC
jgi:hypothetical protein